MSMKRIDKLKDLPRYRPSYYSMFAAIFVVTAMIIAASNTLAEQNTPPPVDNSISMVLIQNYESKKYDYTCNPTLESQEKFKITTFGGEAEVPGEQKGTPPANLTITLPNPPSTWYCTMNSRDQK